MTYSMFDTFFMYNTSLNQTRKEISTFLMSLHQLPEECSFTLSTPAEWPPGFIINQRAMIPHTTQAIRAETFSTPVCAWETVPVWNGFMTSNNYHTAQFPSQLSPFGRNLRNLLVGQVWTQKFKYSYVPLKWNNIIFYILNCPPTIF